MKTWPTLISNIDLNLSSLQYYTPPHFIIRNLGKMLCYMRGNSYKRGTLQSLGRWMRDDRQLESELYFQHFASSPIVGKRRLSSESRPRISDRKPTVLSDCNITSFDANQRYRGVYNYSGSPISVDVDVLSVFFLVPQFERSQLSQRLR